MDSVSLLNPRTGAVLSSLLATSHKWKFRKVDSIRLLEGRVGRRRISLDLQPPEHPALAYDPFERTLRKEEIKGGLMIPLARIEKGELKNFDIRTAGGEPIPVLGKSENAEISAAAILYELGGETAFSKARLIEAVRAVTAGGPQEASSISKQLIENGTYNGEKVIDESDISSYAKFLLDKLATEFLLIALLPAQMCGKRTVIKYSRHWEVLDTGWRPLVLLYTATGFESVALEIDLSSPDEAASYHLEVHAPQGVLCQEIIWPDPTGILLPKNARPTSVAHAVESFRNPPDKGAVLLLQVPFNGMHFMALLVSIFTTIVFGINRFMPGAHEAWLDAPGEAVAVLLVLPAAVLALLTRPGENYLAQRILLPLRAIVLASCLLLVAGGASFVGKLDEPYMGYLWWVGTVAMALVSLALAAAHLVRWLRSRSNGKQVQ